MFIVYVIISEEGYRYTGFTSDIKKRIDQHNSGISRWTKRGTNWQLVYSEQFSNKTEALQRERWLKSGHGREFLNLTLRGS
ncbi:MAG: GIY-YIG nuclease family protein [candidate division Zixibacteria bacterium]|nr:GIY-YIG nuclease family protein [candidate division Zixibacteria bacterium]